MSFVAVNENGSGTLTVVVNDESNKTLKLTVTMTLTNICKEYWQ